MSKQNGKFALGAIVAAVGGYIAGILTAPKSGKETRQDIKDTATKARIEAEKRLKSAHSELQDLIKKAQSKLTTTAEKSKQGMEDAIEKAKGAQSKAKELLTSLHEGGSDDKDLQKAIRDAEQAVEHLKSFVSKTTESGRAKKAK